MGCLGSLRRGWRARCMLRWPRAGTCVYAHMGLPSRSRSLGDRLWAPCGLYPPMGRAGGWQGQCVWGDNSALMGPYLPCTLLFDIGSSMGTALTWTERLQDREGHDPCHHLNVGRGQGRGRGTEPQVWRVATAGHPEWVKARACCTHSTRGQGVAPFSIFYFS